MFLTKTTLSIHVTRRCETQGHKDKRKAQFDKVCSRTTPNHPLKRYNSSKEKLKASLHLSRAIQSPVHRFTACGDVGITAIFSDSLNEMTEMQALLNALQKPRA